MNHKEHAAVAALVKAAKNIKISERVWDYMTDAEQQSLVILERKYRGVEQLPGFRATAAPEEEKLPQPTLPMGKTQAELDAAYLEYYRKVCETYKEITGLDWPEPQLTFRQHMRNLFKKANTP